MLTSQMRSILFHQENILRAMRLANPDKPGDLMRKLMDIDPIAARMIEMLSSAESYRDETPAVKEEAASMMGYYQSGEVCVMCGNFTLIRCGTCLTCQTCGTTTGCS